VLLPQYDFPVIEKAVVSARKMVLVGYFFYFFYSKVPLLIILFQLKPGPNFIKISKKSKPTTSFDKDSKPQPKPRARKKRI
jgi:hypothetical protein